MKCTTRFWIVVLLGLGDGGVPITNATLPVALVRFKLSSKLSVGVMNQTSCAIGSSAIHVKLLLSTALLNTATVQDDGFAR
jgi:hypothetical protein